MIVKTSRVDLFYEKYGAGAPLILIHGNGEDHTIFEEAAALLKEYFTVYAIDSRGHGNSSPVTELHYEDMADDVSEFIIKLQIENPIVYGFSDGGIIALLLSIKYPTLLSRIIVSGVNSHPFGVELKTYFAILLDYFKRKSYFTKLMLVEPHITKKMLRKIVIPVHITSGSGDLIRQNHMRKMAKCIKKCTYTVFQNETHGSYITHSEKIGEYIIKVCVKNKS